MTTSDISSGTSRRCSATVTVALPKNAAMRLFTPEGERSWARGWAPTYPNPHRTEGAGAVFVTEHGGHRTTWVLTGQTGDAVSYARVTARGTAGTVEVRVYASAPDSTTVQVSYDLTALTAEAVTELNAFAARYDYEMANWALAIERSLTRQCRRVD